MHLPSLLTLVPFFIAAVAADAEGYGPKPEIKPQTKGPRTFYIGPSGAVTGTRSHYGYLFYKGAATKSCSQLRININSTEGEYFNGIIPRGKNKRGGKCYWSKDKSIQLFLKKQNCTTKPPYKLMAGNVKEARAKWKAKMEAKCKSEGKDVKDCCKSKKKGRRFRRKFLHKRWKIQKRVKGSKKLTEENGPYLTFNRRSCFYVCTCPQTQVKKVFGGRFFKKRGRKGKGRRSGKGKGCCKKKYEGCERISFGPRERGVVNLQWELPASSTQTSVPAAPAAPSSTEAAQPTQGANQAVSTPSSSVEGPKGYGPS